jgi:hypothetical protein
MIGKVEYEYAFQDLTPRTAEGENADNGTFKTTAALNQVGEWKVHVALFKGNQQTQVKFTLRVGAKIWN